ncbi:MAG TPA: flagellar hook-associated protein FlgK [Stellaceae bacterium]|jgi:flagellar hook-associated protein 1 FlgK|nr:flagellar hook-associated protein FlgK [Stellaceae bacterium]
MIGLADLLNIASSGINAATEGIQTVSNNTANVNTPGYNAQSLNQIELAGVPGGVGAGTDVVSIQRAFDQFVSQQVVQATSTNQAATVVQTTAQNVSSLFPVASGGAGGIGAALDSFFAAANQVATDPSSDADRTALLSAAQSLTSLVNSVGGALASDAAGIDSQTASAVQQVNTLTQQIAGLNKTIIAQTGTTAGPANALLDQRDQLVQQLGQIVGVSVLREANGGLDVYTSGGTALVNGVAATTLAIDPDKFGDGASTIVNSATGQDLTGAISGGTIGGLIASRNLIDSTQNSVGGLAASLAAAVNSEQSLGLDLNGNPGGALFSVSAPTVYAAQGNTGSGTLTATISDSNSFTPADFVLTDTANGFQATNQATGQVSNLGNGPTLSLDGLTVAVSGAVAVGDSFKLAPTATAAQSLRVTTTDPAAIAAASAYVATAGDNAGAVQAAGLGVVAGSALATGAAIVPAADFGQNLTVKFTSQTDFQVLDAGNAVVASGALDAGGNAQIAIAYPASAGGGNQYAAFSLSGGPAASGDSFSLTPGGPGSNGNITALSGIASQKLLAGQTLDNAYAALVTGVGARSQDAQIAAQAAQGVLTQAQNQQQSISGVNLDEQAAELVSYQQAYQASAQVIATAQALFQSLIAAVQGA